MGLQQPEAPKGVADIIFLLDKSGSMSPCIEGVKNNISSFVQGLNSDEQKDIDFRVGFVAQDTTSFQYLPLTTDTDEFSSGIATVSSRGDEFTLPALDFSLDRDWRDGAHKCIVVMTDEPVEGGADVGEQLAQFDALQDKIEEMKAMLYIIGPNCPHLTELSQLPKAFYQELEGKDFGDFDYDKLMGDLGKTVSQSTPTGQQQGASNSAEDLYDYHSWVSIEQV